MKATARRYMMLASFFCAGIAQAQTRDPGRPHEDPPVFMVTLGDSIMWGQGLPEGNKFRNIVEQWIRKQFQGTRTVIQIPTHAHSGAQITVDPGKDGETGLPGEIPSDAPSVTLQVDLTKADLPRFGATPDQVDLVLVDGGINDVDVRTILNPAKHINDLHNLVISNCVLRMQGLLTKVRQAFPSAAIIVTGYFPVASSESDVMSLWALSTAAINDFVVGASGIGSVPGLFVTGAEGTVVKDRMVGLSTEWNNTALAGLSDDINQFIQNDPRNTMIVPGFRGKPRSIPRVALAWPYFSKWNSYAASDTHLWNLLQFAGDELRGLSGSHAESPDTPGQVAYSRAQACIATGQATKGLCMDASMGHPNIAGAQAYANAVINVLQMFPEWVGLRQLNVTVVPATVRPNVLTSIVVRATDLVTGQPVPNAVINFENRLIPAGQPFQHLFTCTPRRPNPRRTPNAIIEAPEFPSPSFTVNAPGFLPATVEFPITGISPGSEMCR